MIKNGNKADAENLNAAFPSRTDDTSLAGEVRLENVDSGAPINNVQSAINETFDTIGQAGEGDAARKDYASQNYVANGDSHKVAIGKLDTAVKAAADSSGTGLITVDRIDGQVPIAKGGTGQSTKSAGFDALSPNTTEGDLTVRGAATNQRLGVGMTGQVLTADAGVPGKVKWAAAPGGDLGSATGTLPIANGGTGQTNKAAAFNAISPTTTKGDLIVMGDTEDVRQPAGTVGQLLTVDPTSPTGLAYKDAPATQANYITNGNFESTAQPFQYTQVPILNGMPNPAGGPSAHTTTPYSVTATIGAGLSGDKGMQFTAASAWAAGDAIAIGPQFTVTTADIGRVLTVSCDYGIETGSTNFKFGGQPPNQGLALILRDVTGQRWIVPNGGLDFTSGFVGSVQASFQPDITGAPIYQLYVINLVTTTGPVSGRFDNFRVYRADVVTRARSIVFAGNRSVSQAVTANVTNITVDAFTDRTASWNGTQYLVPQFGDYELTVSFLMGNAGRTTFPYLNGVFYKSAAFSTSSAGSTLSVGTVLMTDLKPGDLISVRANGNDTIGTAYIAIKYLGGVSSGGDGRVVVGLVKQNGTLAITNGQPIAYNTVEYDTLGGFQNGRYTVQVTGYYDVTAGTFTGDTGGASIYLYKNGVMVRALGTANYGGNGVKPHCRGSTSVYASAGDTLDVRSDFNGTLQNFAIWNYFTVALRNAGSGQPNVAESVSARYTSIATQSVANNTLTTIIFGGKSYDQTASYNPLTGVYSVSASGKFFVKANTVWQPSNFGAGYYPCHITVNGVIVKTEYTTTLGGASVAVPLQVSDTLDLKPNDTVEIKTIQNTGAARTLTNSSTEAVFTITRVAVN